jgi:hypothetical protein
MKHKAVLDGRDVKEYDKPRVWFLEPWSVGWCVHLKRSGPADIEVVEAAELAKAKDEIGWLESQLAQANAEVKKGREIIEYAHLVDPYPDLSADKYVTGFRLLRERINKLLESYID